MLTEAAARQFAHHWMQAWNSHDLEQIMSHYTDDVALVSPVAKALLDVPSGEVRGKAALRAYFQKALAAYPELKFELMEVMWGLNSVVLYYANQRGTHSGEFMELDADGKVLRVVANYNG